MISQDIRRTIATLSLLLVATACGGKDDAAADSLAGREIELAPQAGTDTTLNDAAPTKAPATVAAAPRPTTTAPRPTTTAPRPASARTGVISAGSVLAVNTGTRVCTNTHKVGDRFTATLASSVDGTNGVSIPAGSSVVLRVTESARSQNTKDNVKLAFAIVSVSVGAESYDVMGDVTQVAALETVRAQSTQKQAGKVATGAAIGAIAGQILGKNTKSTVIGAAAGAAAGGAVAAGTADYDGCLPAGGQIRIALSSPLTLAVS